MPIHVPVSPRLTLCDPCHIPVSPPLSPYLPRPVPMPIPLCPPRPHVTVPRALALLAMSLRCPQVLLDYFPTLMKAVGSSEKIFEFLDREPQVAPSGTMAPADLQGHLQLEDVWFSYPGRQEPVLKVGTETQPGDTGMWWDSVTGVGAQWGDSGTWM